MISIVKKECPFCPRKWIDRYLDPIWCPGSEHVITKIETGALSAKSVTPAIIPKGVTS